MLIAGSCLQETGTVVRSVKEMNMRRREFMKSSLMVGGACAWGRAPFALAESSQTTQAADAQVKRVMVMFKCHFDAGFVDTQKAVVNRYFTKYFPQAIQVAEEVGQAGVQRYVWTTGSWLLYELSLIHISEPTR